MSQADQYGDNVWTGHGTARDTTKHQDLLLPICWKRSRAKVGVVRSSLEVAFVLMRSLGFWCAYQPSTWSNARVTPAILQHCCDTFRSTALTLNTIDNAHNSSSSQEKFASATYPQHAARRFFKTPSITASPNLPMVCIACSLLKTKKVECRSIDLPPSALHSAVHGSQQSGSA